MRFGWHELALLTPSTPEEAPHHTAQPEEGLLLHEQQAGQDAAEHWHKPQMDQASKVVFFIEKADRCWLGRKAR